MSRPEGHHLTIQRLNCRYHVPAGLLDPEKVRWRLDEVLRTVVPDACGRLLSQVFDSGHPDVWLIRSLDVDLALDPGAVDGDGLSRAWSRWITASIVRTITADDDGERVLHFPDRTAYLAQFLIDLAEGRAWGRWYYAPLESLRSLPTSAAVREALVREPERAEAVLLHLSKRSKLEGVIAALSPADARRVVECCAGEGSPVQAQHRQVFEALLSAWPAAGLGLTPDGQAGPQNLLRLYLAVRERSPGLAGRELRLAAGHLLELVEILQRVGRPGELIERLTAGDLDTAVGMAGGLEQHRENLSYFRRAAAGDATWLARLARVTASPSTFASATEHPPADRTLITPFGGIFLLLPAWIELDLEGLIERATYPELEGIGSTQALRFLLMLKCLGRPRALEAFFDPVLRLASGLEERAALESLVALGAGVDSLLHSDCLRRWLEAQARGGRLEARCLAADLATLPTGEEVLLLREIPRGAWLWASCLSAGETRITNALKQGLDFVQQAVGAPAECLLLESALGERIPDGAMPSLQSRLVWTAPAARSAPFTVSQPGQAAPLLLWAAEPEALSEPVRMSLGRYPARCRPAGPDLAYLSLLGLHPPLAAGPDFDLIWSVIAHTVLRTFSGRLVGFEGSSAEYLYQNFLEGLSTLDFKDGEIAAVHLPASPMRIILCLAGVDGQTLSLPWLGNTVISLQVAS